MLFALNINQPSVFHRFRFRFPQHNGDVFAFTDSVNRQFVHGVPRECPGYRDTREKDVVLGCTWGLVEITTITLYGHYNLIQFIWMTKSLLCYTMSLGTGPHQFLSAMVAARSRAKSVGACRHTPGRAWDEIFLIQPCCHFWDLCSQVSQS